MNPASGRKHWENTSNLVRQPEQPIATPETKVGNIGEVSTERAVFAEIGKLQKGQMVAFEAALPKGSCSPYGWNLAEVLNVDAGNHMAQVWLWNNQHGSTDARMHRVWWRGSDEFHVEEEKYSPTNPGTPFQPFTDRVHWSRIWEAAISLKGGRVPEDTCLRLAQRLVEFRQRAKASRKKARLRKGRSEAPQ
jgi:hypothetical protein